MFNDWKLERLVPPQRYILGFMGFMAIVNAYTMRVSLNIAITEMVVPNNSSDKSDPNGCPAPDLIITNTTHLKNQELYPWDSQTQGIILGAFYYGYLFTHLPGGILAEKFGGKYTLSLGILSTAIFTLITPWVIRKSNGHWGYIVALRVVEGLGEGTTYPAINALLAQWVPLHERAKIGSLVFAGGQMGTIVSNFISGALIDATGQWSSVFYLFGSIGVLWFILFTILCYSTPQEHPFISEKERSYLRKELDNVSQEALPVPWRAILTSAPLWALVCAQIGHDWGFYTLVTDLPTYFKDVLKFNIANIGIWSSVPYVAMWVVSMFSGYLCDWLIKKNYMTVTFSRKFFTTVASMGPAFFLMAASYSNCDASLAVIMLTIGMGFMGTFYCGMKVNALDLAPNFAGTLMAIVNGIGSITGIISPYMAGVFTKNHTLLEWRLVFWVSFGVFTATNIVYVVFASGEEQWWNNPKKNKSSEEGLPAVKENINLNSVENKPTKNDV